MTNSDRKSTRIYISRLMVCLLCLNAVFSFQANDTPTSGDPQGNRASLLYAVNGLSNDISTYEIQRVAFRTLGSAPTGIGPLAAEIDPKGDFLFAANRLGEIDVFRIKDSAEDPTFLGSVSTGLAPTPNFAASGDFLYVNGSSLVIYRLNRQTGLTRLGEVASGVGPVAISANGRFVVVAGQSRLHDEGELILFSRDPVSGALSEVPCQENCTKRGRFPLGDEPRSVVVSATHKGHFVFVANRSSDDLSVFNLRSDGTLTRIRCQGVSCNSNNRVTADQPSALAVSPNGRFLFVGGADYLTVFEFDETRERITGRSRVKSKRCQSQSSVTSSPVSLKVSPNGRFLLVANEGGGFAADHLNIYELEPTGLALDCIGSVSVDAPGSLAIAPSGQSVFIPSRSIDSVEIFRLEESSGVLSGARFIAGQGPAAATVSPDGNFLYVANSASNDLSVVALHETWRPSERIKVGTTPVSLAVSHQKRLLLVANAGSDDVTVLPLAETDGEFQRPVILKAGSTPSAIAVSPDGSLALVTNFSSNNLSLFRITNLADSDNGGRPESDNLPVGDGPVGAAFSPDGRFVIVANQESAELTVFAVVDGSIDNPDIEGSRNYPNLILVQRLPVLRLPRDVAISPSGRFVFVPHARLNVITVLELNPNSGQLAFKRLVPTGRFPTSVEISPDERFVFVTNADEIDFMSGDVSAFRLDPVTGLLSELSRVRAGASPVAAAVSSDGRSIYVANFGSDDLSQIRIDETNIALKASARSFPSGIYPVSVAWSPDRTHAFAVNLTSEDLTVYSFDERTGVLRSLSDVPGLSAPRSVALSLNGQFLYVANSATDDLSIFESIHGGGLRSLGRVRVGDSPVSLAAAGSYLFVANQASNDVSVLQMDAATGSLAELDRIPAGPLPTSIAVSESLVVVATNMVGEGATDGSVTVFEFDQGSGTLTQLVSRPSGGTTVAVAASDPFVFSCDIDSGAIRIFRLNRKTGVLEETPGSPLLVGGLPTAVAASPERDFVFVADASANEVTAFQFDRQSGTLRAINRASTGELPLSLAISSTGVLMTANGNSDSVSLLRLDAEVGLTASPQTARSPRSIAFHPTGHFAYVSNFIEDRLSIHLVDADSGVLSPFLDPPTVASGDGPSAAAVDRQGRRLYVANSNSGTVGVYDIEEGGGRLDFVEEVPTGLGPYDLVLHSIPRGDFLYAANFEEDSITVFKRGPQGRLTAIDRTPTPPGPVSLVIASVGKYLFSANFQDQLEEGRGSISQFEILPDGRLTLVQTFAAGRAPIDLATAPGAIEGESYLYAVNSGSNEISQFRINGTLPVTLLGATATDDGPTSIISDAAGDALYVANNAANTVSVYGVNRDTGELTFQRAAPAGVAPQGLALAPAKP